MLKPIAHVIANPNDFPDVPRLVKEYLQSRFNHSYLVKSGYIRLLKQEGHSEAYIAGVIAGLDKAADIIDEIETRKEQLQEV
ncbi:hypothetical protein pEp_SNUABM10_00024 [Erwinia phage pEp_SNUABM_10]|nr:hypothetical protein pEp_SNUABM03_00021 [Erwinia phage pEp_SNUABM_03]QOC57678.1 hypothetical protein pEp_SNUABM04_00024 [Erwinia phage pEp_SNUABM_04]QOC57728.1 hypothetical protein pEp_SNUABM10_00024 [Erwinia phage pEp_SNUABM_10]QOC57781.1 hypothetical protein pEp_SNUABM11_00025 [Erwinia phage pEp_SNUABM_11]